jgi:hypothetical protein
MALKLVVRNKARVSVSGTVNDENGSPVKFDFVLLCKRINQTAIDAVMEDRKSSVQKFLHSVVEGWEGVLNADDTPRAFSPENLSDTLETPGLHTVCFHAYLKEVGAVAKNL